MLPHERTAAAAEKVKQAVVPGTLDLAALLLVAEGWRNQQGVREYAPPGLIERCTCPQCNPPLGRKQYL